MNYTERSKRIQKDIEIFLKKTTLVSKQLTCLNMYWTQQNEIGQKRMMGSKQKFLHGYIIIDEGSDTRKFVCKMVILGRKHAHLLSNISWAKLGLCVFIT